MDQRGLLRLTPCSIGAFEPQSTPFPTLDALSSSSGSTTGGSSVTVTGMGFASGATILFGTASASPPGVVTGTTITATVPAHSAGTVDVTVTNPDGQAATLNLAYTFGTVKALPDPRSTAQPIMTFPKPLPDLSRPTGVPSGSATPNPLPPHR
ncbi:MAG: IPT/TIG domain-containing protein [Chloroflexota bacterium]|nr:IPT/TIG domain-containing protein [Chloroflexota bacterium]